MFRELLLGLLFARRSSARSAAPASSGAGGTWVWIVLAGVVLGGAVFRAMIGR